MADRRRRRGPVEDSGEDAPKISPDGKPQVRKSECESEHGEEADAELSEYESADEDKRDEEDESEEETDEDDDDDDEEEETDDDEDEDDDGQDISVVIEDDDWVDEERQSGDGEEQPDSTEVDDDEDRKNPAFVPRKGAFYEHDSRMGDKESKAPKEDPERPKKKLWKDDGKWLHDGYNELLQAPKTREELIAIYGYDVRAGSQPPEYRPRPRRGGRGRRSAQNNKFGDYLPAETIEMAEKNINRSHSEENEYVPMEYRTPPYENRSRQDYRPRNQGYNNRQKTRSYGSDSRQRGDNYEQQDNYMSKGDNYRYENRGRNDQGDNRQRDKTYNDFNRFTQEYKNSPNNRGYTDTKNNQPDYRQSDYRSQDQDQHYESETYYRGRGRGQRGRGRGQRPYKDNENENRNFTPGGLNNSPRQFTNSNYRVPEKTETRYEQGVATDVQSSKEDVVISNKENVQTISVTITNTTTEKKSYSKDRRTAGRPNVPVEPPNALTAEATDTVTESPPAQTSTKTTDPASQGGAVTSSKQSKNSSQSASGQSKQDASLQSRPKRYSSQRQRPAPQMDGSHSYYNQGYPSSQYYNEQNQSPSQDSPTYTPTQMLPPTIPYPLSAPVSTSNMANAPRLYPASPAPIASTVPISTNLPAPHPQMIPPQYLGQGTVIYGAAPPGINPAQPFPVPMGYAGGSPQQQFQSPPTQQPEVYRGGTIYYPPELQQTNPHRSPARRTKSAIPIVNPQEVKAGSRVSGLGEGQEEEEIPGGQDYTPVPQDTSYEQADAEGGEGYDDTEDIRNEIKEITSALVSLEGELRAGSTKVRQKDEEMKNRDLQQKLDSYLQSVETPETGVSNKAAASQETEAKYPRIPVQGEVTQVPSSVTEVPKSQPGNTSSPKRGADHGETFTLKQDTFIQNLELREVKAENISHAPRSKVEPVLASKSASKDTGVKTDDAKPVKGDLNLSSDRNDQTVIGNTDTASSTKIIAPAIDNKLQTVVDKPETVISEPDSEKVTVNERVVKENEGVSSKDIDPVVSECVVISSENSSKTDVETLSSVSTEQN